MLRLSVVALLASLVACGGGGASATKANEPQTAREKLAAEEAANKDKDEPSTRPVGKWRYSGDRGSCFFRVKQKCFKTEASACAAAKCGKAKCEVEGAAPAQVSCAKSDAKED